MARGCVGTTLDRINREGLFKEMIFDLKLTRYPIGITRGRVGIEKSEYWKCPEAGKSLVCSRTSKQADMLEGSVKGERVLEDTEKEGRLQLM